MAEATCRDYRVLASRHNAVLPMPDGPSIKAAEGAPLGMTSRTARSRASSASSR